MGLLRLLTNSRVMGSEALALSAAQAWAVRDQFRSDPRSGFIQEPPGFNDDWRRTSRAGKIGPNFWTDAYLISLCSATECTLLTFDKALARHRRCEVCLLSGESS